MDKVRIHEMLECMTKWCLSELDKGKEHVDVKEMGEAIDMVKDLAEAEKAVWEKCYYEKIVEAMEEDKEEWEKMTSEDRSGYDRWRRASGRFAPKGHGHETSMAMATGRRGFTPDPWPNPPYYDDPRMWDGRMDVAGYPDDGSRRETTGRPIDSGSAGRMGYSPDGKSSDNTGSARDGRRSYDNARRYFHESGSQESKMMMDEKGKEYVGEAMMTIRDIFSEADPQLQKKMKEDLGRLYREFGGQ